MKKIIITVFLIMAYCLSYADNRFIGSWVVEKHSSSMKFAATLNESGNAFGQYCFVGEGQCVYLLGIRTSCEKGSTYPVLMNSDSGSGPYSVYCNGPLDSGLYQYIFTEFEKIDGITKTANKIGFAFPLQGDQFQVIRFSLFGSNEAIKEMRDSFNNGNSRSSEEIL